MEGGEAGDGEGVRRRHRAAAALVISSFAVTAAPAPARGGAADPGETVGFEFLRAELRALAVESRREREWRGSASLVSGGLSAAGGAAVLGFGEGADRDRTGTGLLAGGALLAARGFWLRRAPRPEEQLFEEIAGDCPPEQVPARFAYGDSGFADLAARAHDRRLWSAAGSFSAAVASWFLLKDEDRDRRLLVTALPVLGGFHTLTHRTRQETAFRHYRRGLAALQY